MIALCAAIAVLVLGLLGVAGRVRELEARVHGLDRLVEKLEGMAHPPVDLRPAMKTIARAEVERFLEEHVP